MVDITKPIYGDIWANAGETLNPGTTKIASGWIQEMMPFQYENWLQNRTDIAISYLLQKGIPEWSAEQEYTANKSVVTYGGQLYMAITTTTNVLPTIVASWKRLTISFGANGAVPISFGGTGATTAADARTNLGIGSAATVDLPTTNGIVTKLANNSLVARTITGTSGYITVTNGDAVSGNPTITVGENVAKTDADAAWSTKTSIKLPTGTSAERGVGAPGRIRFNMESGVYEGYDNTGWNPIGSVGALDVQNFQGDGIRTTFTLSSTPRSENNTQVYFNGVYQQKNTYNLVGNDLVFDEAPTPDTNIEVVNVSSVPIGTTTAAQTSIVDSGNYFSSGSVEGALQEVGLKASFVKDAILSYPDYAAASAAAATLSDGQVVDDVGGQYRYTAEGGVLTDQRDIVALANIRFNQFPGVSATRTAEQKIQESKSVEDYYFATDLGNINNAIARAVAAGVKVLKFTSQEKYYIDDYVAINRNHFTMCSDSFLATEIVLKGSAGLMFDIGSDSQVRSGLQLQNLVLSRETGNSDSNVIRMRNLAYWRMIGLRFYMDNKFARAVDATSMLYGRSLDTIYENSLLEHVAMRGGVAASGTVGGRCVENFFFDNESRGANLSNSAEAKDCAAFKFGDNMEATWLVNQRCHSHKGFMASFIGTPENIARNTLNLIINPNVEAAYAGSGVAHFENSRSNVVYSNGWISTNALPAVSFGLGASSNTFVCAKVGVKGGAAVCEDAGIGNTFKGAEIQGYDGAGGVGVVFKTGCGFPIVENISGVSIASMVVNQAGAEIGATIDGVKYRSLTASPIVGMNNAGNNKVRRLINQGASPYYGNSSSTLNLPIGVDDMIQVTGTAVVSNIRPGLFFGEIVEFRMADSGMTLKDLDNVAGGNIANNPKGTDVVSDGRTIVKYRWNGSAWYQF